jgi:hypothetical protein
MYGKFFEENLARFCEKSIINLKFNVFPDMLYSINAGYFPGPFKRGLNAKKFALLMKEK